MAQDATGTPTPLGIPKYNPASDAPSGKGFNNAMDAIDALIQSKALPTASGSSKVPVWNGSAWVADTLPAAGVTPGSPGQVLSTLIGGAVGWAGLPAIFNATVTGSPGNFTFSSIPNNFSHLLVIAHGRSNVAANPDSFAVRFNGDVGATSYFTQQFWGSGATSNAALGTNTFAPVAQVAGNSAAAGMQGVMAMFIPNYAGTTFSSGWVGIGGTPTGGGYAVISSGTWNPGSPTAINSITLFAQTGGTFTVGSRMTVYGIG